jgi:hypothetical protein
MLFIIYSKVIRNILLVIFLFKAKQTPLIWFKTYPVCEQYIILFNIVALNTSYILYTSYDVDLLMQECRMLIYNYTPRLALLFCV